MKNLLVNVLVKRSFLLFRIFRSCFIYYVSLSQCSCDQTPKLQKLTIVSGTCFLRLRTITFGLQKLKAHLLLKTAVWNQI